jgi:hypothetical protein
VIRELEARHKEARSPQVVPVADDYGRARVDCGPAARRARSAGEARRHAARFCSVFSTVCNQSRPGRHALSALNYRTVMRRR